MKHLSRTRIKFTFSPAPVCSTLALIFFMALAGCVVAAAVAGAQVSNIPSQPAGEVQLILGEATVCELVKNGIPFNSAIALSISLGRIYCFTDFVSVSAKTVIYHNWYHRDRKRASVKLALRPPRWATFSSVLLRKDDKGPWQVEVTTEKGEVLQILRFSVID